MSRFGIAGWAIALVLGLILVLGSDDASAERAAKEAAQARAETLQVALDSVGAAHTATIDSLARQAAEEARAAQAARERARLAESSAGRLASRLREQLTARQQEELDAVTDFYEEALREEREVSARMERQRDLALAEAEAERTFRLRETERADAWKDAFDAAEAEINALQRKDVQLFGFGFDVDCGPGGGIGSNEPLKPEIQVACIVPVI